MWPKRENSGGSWPPAFPLQVFKSFVDFYKYLQNILKLNKVSSKEYSKYNV